MTSGVNVAVPFISQEFHADAVLLSWVMSAFLLVLSVFLLPLGRIGDIIGLKKIFLWGMGLFTVVSLITIFSNSILMLIICRCVQGLACAMIFGTNMALVTATHPGNKRGRALGINVSAVYVGYSAGPFLGGLLTEHLGWRSLFAIVVPVGIAVILIVLLKIKDEWSQSQGEKFDIRGSIVYGISLIALIYGFSLIPEITGIVLAVIGVIGILMFLKLEAGTGSPVLNINIFRNNRALLFANMSTLISYCATFAIAYLMSLYLQYIKGLSPDHAGIVLLSQPIMLAVCAPFTGRLSDKIEPRIAASIGMALTFIGLLLLSLLPSNSSIVYIIAILIVIGIGQALFIAPNNNAVMSAVIPKYYGIASAANATMRSIGQVLSMAITTVVLAIIIGRVEITPANYPSFITSTTVSFAIFSILGLGGIFTSLIRGKTRKSP
jgi:EmrB/QacA subfamily drug resistance transporter